MSQDKKRRRGPSEDSVDPDSFFAPAVDARVQRKDRQLCRQVHEALNYAFPALEDSVLRELWVIDVAPAPDAARLCAVVEAPRDADLSDVYTRLERVAGHLRSEVAQAITRKRAPT